MSLSVALQGAPSPRSHQHRRELSSSQWQRTWAGSLLELVWSPWERDCQNPMGFSAVRATRGPLRPPSARACSRARLHVSQGGPPNPAVTRCGNPKTLHLLIAHISPATIQKNVYRTMPGCESAMASRETWKSPWRLRPEKACRINLCLPKLLAEASSWARSLCWTLAQMPFQVSNRSHPLIWGFCMLPKWPGLRVQEIEHHDMKFVRLHFKRNEIIGLHIVPQTAQSAHQLRPGNCLRAHQMPGEKRRLKMTSAKQSPGLEPTDVWQQSAWPWI